MSNKLEALANLLRFESPSNTLQNTRDSITHFINCKYNLSAFNDKYVTDFIRDFDNKIFHIKNTRKTNKELIVKDEVLKVFRDDLLVFYRQYALSYLEEVKNFSSFSTEPTYQAALNYLQNKTTNETVYELNSFKLSRQERLIYPNCFARILERRVRSLFGPGLVNSVKTKIKQLSPVDESQKSVSDVWNRYYGQNFLEGEVVISFTDLIKCVKTNYESYTSSVTRLVLLFNLKVKALKDN